MAKRRSGTALFDLLGQPRGGTTELPTPGGTLAPPGSVQHPSRQSSAGSSASTGDVDRQSCGTGAASSESADNDVAALGGPQSHTVGPSAGRMLEFDAARIRVSFSSWTAAVAIFLFVAVVMAAYEVGRRNGARANAVQSREASRRGLAGDALDDVQAARRMPPATDLLAALELADANAPAGGAERVPPNAGALPPAADWVPGQTYIVVQEFTAGSGDAAARAREFLHDRRIETVLVRTPAGSIQLITVEGFNRKDPEQAQRADALLARVRDAGTAYYDAGGRYRLQGYFKLYKRGRW
ncbi:MAG: hypothetical protein ACE5E6_05510 [Phycisphaerae bacterium]